MYIHNLNQIWNHAWHTYYLPTARTGLTIFWISLAILVIIMVAGLIYHKCAKHPYHWPKGVITFMMAMMYTLCVVCLMSSFVAVDNISPTGSYRKLNSMLCTRGALIPVHNKAKRRVSAITHYSDIYNHDRKLKPVYERWQSEKGYVNSRRKYNHMKYVSRSRYHAYLKVRDKMNHNKHILQEGYLTPRKPTSTYLTDTMGIYLGGSLLFAILLLAVILGVMGLY